MNTPDNSIKQASTVVRGGGIIIYPTDTAFGIGCRMDNPEAVDRLFAIRKRPLSQATPVLVDSVDMALAYFDKPSGIVRHLMKIYWPGALTIIAPCKIKLVYSPIRGDSEKIGIRMPDHPTIRTIIRESGIPILGPSANFHGEPTPFVRSDINPELIRLVNYVVDGNCKGNQASTVVDCSVQPLKIIRQGSVVISI